MSLPIQPRSIAFRLIVAVLAVELLSAILVVVFSFGYERHIHFRAFDVMLHGRADSLLGAVQEADDPGNNLMVDLQDLHAAPEDIFEVYDSSGRLLSRSPNWAGAGSSAPAHPQGDFSQLTLNGHHYRVLRMQGSRLIDPGENGGKLYQVVVLYGSPTSHVWHAIRGAVAFYAAGSLLLLVVTGPLIAWLLHRGLLPLRQLAALASNVSVDSWHFSPPPSARTTPELAPLTHALESVLQRLERSFLQQQAFVSDAAHELKTSVAVVKSSLQLLTLRPRSSHEYKAGLELCLADLLRLEDIVARMLTLARLENPSPAAGPAPSADLAEAVQSAAAQLQSLADLRQVRVDIAIPPYACPVPVDREDLTVLLSNLLLNALQHSPPASTVELRLGIQDQAAILTMEDHGEGITPEALPHVFDRFYRGDPSRTRTTGGTGLGLAIARAIAQKADGAVTLASQPEQGTTVTVRLPLVTPFSSP